MNFVLLVLLLVMIAFTIYNFSKDIRNSINTGKPIVEGMNSSQNAMRNKVASRAGIENTITDTENAQESTKYDDEMIDNNGDNKLTQSNGFEDKRPAPEEPNWFSDEVSDNFIQLEDSVDENGVIMTKNTGVCPHNCKASEFANSSCVDEIFEGKEYKKCKWTKDGKNDSQCDKCGAVLIPKNEFGFARTDAENTNSQKVDKITKQDFYNEGKYFIGKVAENNGIKLPSDIENKHYIETGKILYKYKYSRTTEVTSYLHKYVKALLSPSSFKNEDRGGGSNSAYTLNYKPVDPRIAPKPYDSFWHVF